MKKIVTVVFAVCCGAVLSAESPKAEWVNTGSSSGRFGFDWASAGVTGINLAACPQGSRKSFAKLKARRAEIADGAYVIIPLCPFTSVLRSNYDETHHGKEDHPLLSFDGTPDKKALDGFRDLLDEIWKGEFQIKDYADPMTEQNKKSYGEMVEVMKGIIAWCKAEKLKPVFVCPPAAKTFDNLFPESFMKAYIVDFVRDVGGDEVPFYNFWKSPDYRDDALFANALFLNKTGRRKFTADVIARVKGGAVPKKEAVFFVGAHPDDSEGFAATAFLLRDKYDIHVIDLTRGELGLGMDGYKDGTTAKRRTTEEEAACGYLGATPHFLAEIDGFACAGKPSVEKLTKLIDDLKPRAIFTHWPVDTHADHVQTAAVTLNALRFAKHKPERYFFEVMIGQTMNFRPTYYVDVTSTISNKVEMLKHYVCQGGETYLWKGNWDRAKLHGKECGFDFAEMFATFDGKPIKGGVLEPLKKVVVK